MKKILSTIIVVAMMLSMVSFANVFAAETLITSESFEAGAGSWILPENEVNKAAFSFVDDATDGKKAVKMVDDSEELSAPTINSEKFTVKAGESYKVTLDYKHISGSPFGFALRFFGADGKKIADTRAKTKVSTEWAELVIVGAAPEGAETAMVLFAGNKATLCEMYFDNVKVYSTDEKAEVAAPAAPSTSTTTTPATTVVAPVTGDVLFTDSFENGLDLWKPFSKNGAENVEIVTTEHSDGAKSLHCVDETDATAPAYITANYFGVEPGVTYSASCDYKLVSGDSFKLILRFFDADNKKISDKTVASKSTDWAPVTATLAAPEGAVSCAVLIAGFSKNLGEAYFDNVKLVKASGGTTGSTEAPANDKLNKVMEKSIVLFIGSPNALVNGTKTLIDKTNDKVIANTINSRTLVPVRFIAENYGAEVGWDEATETVTLKLADKVVTIVLNKNEIKINDQVITIDVPAQTIEGRTMLPLRAFVEQVMGKTIFWDDRGLIVITDEPMLDAADTTTVNGIINKIK